MLSTTPVLNCTAKRNIQRKLQMCMPSLHSCSNYYVLNSMAKHIISSHTHPMFVHIPMIREATVQIVDSFQPFCLWRPNRSLKFSIVLLPFCYSEYREKVLISFCRHQLQRNSGTMRCQKTLQRIGF